MKNAYFAAGCFWGVEYYFKKIRGVIKTTSGYMGGRTTNPNYLEICTGTTRHLEAVKVEYDEKIVSFKALTKLFFEIHNMEQTNGQGPDLGNQYLSAVFYNNNAEKIIVQNLIDILTLKGYCVATKLIQATKYPFFPAEDYHQDYYLTNNKKPYCHFYNKIFD